MSVGLLLISTLMSSNGSKVSDILEQVRHFTEMENHN